MNALLATYQSFNERKGENLLASLIFNRNPIELTNMSSDIPIGSDANYVSTHCEISPVPLFGINISEKVYYTFKKPLQLELRQDGKWFFAENETLQVVGTGSTVEEAVDDIKGHLMFFREYYMKISADKLAEDAIQLKKTYSEIFAA